MRSGRIKSGTRLPAVRLLASQLGVNPNTAASAYARLREGGWVTTDGRRGTRVAEPAIQIEHAFALPAGLRDLASGNVDGTLLPCPDTAWLVELHSSAGYDAPADAPELLEQAALWLASQGVPHDDVGVYSGALDAIERALRLRTRAGDRVAVEDPCWPPLLALLASLRLKAVPLTVDGGGVQVSDAVALAACAAVVLTPRAHNPTGASTRPERLIELYRLLRRSPNTLLILDDYWGPLNLSPLPTWERRLPQWLYVASLSKFLGPDLRVAVASGTATLMQEMRRQQSVGPRWVSLLLQRLAARLWQRTRGDGSIERVRLIYAKRRQALLSELRGQKLGPAAEGDGLHLWLPVHDETAVVQAMASLGWAVQAGRPFRLQSPPAVRISLASLPIGDMPRLAADIASCMRAPRCAVY